MIPTIAVDAMGGDFAPSEIVNGSIKAAKDFNIKIILVGISSKIKSELNRFNGNIENIEIYPASMAVDMADKAVRNIRSIEDSSIAICAKLVKDGKANVMISAGNTGAVMSVATITIGRAEGIPRPTIGIMLPTKKPVFLLDIGANAICKPEHMVHFSIIGSAYYRCLTGADNPTVGLLNIGEEKGKGNTFARSAYKLLETAPVNFIGNIEGYGIPNAECDVIVCDGFTGNIVLKVLEGMGKLFGTMLKQEINSSFKNKIGGMVLKDGLNSLFEKINPDRYGGAQLLGLNGICIIAHGRSKSYAIYNAIRVAVEELNKNLLQSINNAIKGARA